RLLGTHRRALGAGLCREAQLELLREVDDCAELLLDELRVAAQAAAHTLAELTQRPQLFLVQAFGAQARAERQEIGARLGEPLASLLGRFGVLPPVAGPRIPNAAAPVVPAAGIAAEVGRPEVAAENRVGRLLEAAPRAAGLAAALLSLLPGLLSRLLPLARLTLLVLSGLLLAAALTLLLLLLGLLLSRLTRLTLLLPRLPLLLARLSRLAALRALNRLELAAHGLNLGPRLSERIRLYALA